MKCMIYISKKKKVIFTHIFGLGPETTVANKISYFCGPWKLSSLISRTSWPIAFKLGLLITDDPNSCYQNFYFVGNQFYFFLWRCEIYLGFIIINPGVKK